MFDLIPLRLLAVGQRAEIQAVVGLPDQTRRLHELGFRQGVHVQVLQSGSPCIVRLDQSKICFRDSEASSIFVRSEASA